MKKLLLVITIVLFTVMPLCAEAYLNSNDLESESLTANKDFDGVEILATAEKGVTIESIDDPRESEDGEVFNCRIKLNGSGKPNYRAIKFDAQKGELLSIYLNSSSKKDSRVLILATTGGEQIATFEATPDTGVAGYAEIEIPKDDEYLIFSKSGGINIYALISE